MMCSFCSDQDLPKLDQGQGEDWPVLSDPLCFPCIFVVNSSKIKDCFIDFPHLNRVECSIYCCYSRGEILHYTKSFSLTNLFVA